jgi:predicted hydrocarbon binding protein
VGRLLAACLHQAITDKLPQRLEFYEEWLRGQAMRDGSIGLAPITGVLGFLRTEGDAYQAVVERAGRLAADWSVSSLSPARRRVLTALPRPLRLRAALAVARAIVADVYSVSRATTRLERGVVAVTIRESPFCLTREPPTHPLCGFYAALLADTVTRFGIAAVGRTGECRTMGAAACTAVVDLS